MRRAFLAAQALILVASAVSAQQSAPCRDGERYRALDFWVGEWRAVDPAGETVGTNRIEKRQAGCVIEEHWSSAKGGGGQSMNYLDPATGLWKQHWVDQGGTVVHYAGAVEGGVLRYEGQHVRADGTVRMARALLEPIEGGRLHHLIEHSDDGGETWTIYFDATYLPLGGQIAAGSEPSSVDEPDAAVTPEGEMGTLEAPEEIADSEPPTGEEEVEAEVEATAERAPAPTAAPPAEPESSQRQASRQAREEDSEVTAVSRVLGREEIPEEQAPELRMASPMVLEITPGPIDRLPENTAWPTDETKGFICNDIVVKKVMMARRARRGEVEIEVGVNLFTAKRIRRADLLVEILLDGRALASARLDDIRVGLNIPAHGKEGLQVMAELTVSKQEFAQLFAEGADRKLRLTLSVP